MNLSYVDLFLYNIRRERKKNVFRLFAKVSQTGKWRRKSKFKFIAILEKYSLENSSQ